MPKVTPLTLVFALVLLVTGCGDATAPDEAASFSLGALKVNVDAEASAAQKTGSEISYTIEVTNKNDVPATKVAVKPSFYLDGREVASGASTFLSDTRLFIPAHSSTSTTGNLKTTASGDLCYDYELEAAPEGGNLKSKTYGGTCSQ